MRFERLRDGGFAVGRGSCWNREARDEGGVHFAEARVGEEVREAAGGEPAGFEEFVDAAGVDCGVDVFYFVEGGGRDGGWGCDTWWRDAADIEEVFDFSWFCCEGEDFLLA